MTTIVWSFFLVTDQRARLELGKGVGKKGVFPWRRLFGTVGSEKRDVEASVFLCLARGARKKTDLWISLFSLFQL